MCGRGKSTKAKEVYLTKRKRANLIFPVTRILRYMKRQKMAKRVRIGASVYMAAVLEYLVAEVLEIAGKVAHASSVKRIKNRHILLAVRSDEEIDALLSSVTIAGGGVRPHIEQALLPKRTHNKSSRNE